MGKRPKNNGQFYDSAELETKYDLDKQKPLIKIITSNRSDGKTTHFLNKAIDRFDEDGSQLALLYRRKYELPASAELFKEVIKNHPVHEEMTAKSFAQGMLYILYLDGEEFGYALCLSKPDVIKKYSSMFARVWAILMDEYQSETGDYLKKEPRLLQSIYQSVARGGGKQSRPVEIILLGNLVTLMNPFLIYFDIHKRLRADTRFIRGHGWIFEFHYNENAAKAIRENAVGRAFVNDDYMKYSTENVYLIDSDTFVERPDGRYRYICTIRHDSVDFGVREYYDAGMIHISRKKDPSCKTILTFKASNHNANTVMLNHFSWLFKQITSAYTDGYLRFEDIASKNAIFDIIGVDLYK